MVLQCVARLHRVCQTASRLNHVGAWTRHFATFDHFLASRVVLSSVQGKPASLARFVGCPVLLNSDVTGPRCGSFNAFVSLHSHWEGGASLVLWFATVCAGPRNVFFRYHVLSSRIIFFRVKFKPPSLFRCFVILSYGVRASTWHTLVFHSISRAFSEFSTTKVSFDSTCIRIVLPRPRNG